MDQMEGWEKNRPLGPGDAPQETRLSRLEREREREEKHKEALEDKLERGLEETFPASDPVAIVQPPHSVYDRGWRRKRIA